MVENFVTCKKCRKITTFCEKDIDRSKKLPRIYCPYCGRPIQLNETYYKPKEENHV